jgi:hypothetical protein
MAFFIILKSFLTWRIIDWNMRFEIKHKDLIKSSYQRAASFWREFFYLVIVFYERWRFKQPNSKTYPFLLLIFSFLLFVNKTKSYILFWVIQGMIIKKRIMKKILKNSILLKWCGLPCNFQIVKFSFFCHDI